MPRTARPRTREPWPAGIGGPASNPPWRGASGGVLVGKLTTTEGASGVHHPSIPAPKNPWNPDYWTGASSSGSGAATAAGLCFGSLGSDTGGSIRFPSQCCGLVGIKATWGRVSRFGVFPLAPTLDHVGPMTRRVEDAAAMLQVIAGRCEADTSTFFDPLPDYEAACAAPVRGLRVGVDEAALSNDVDPAIARAVERAIEVLVARGAERRTVQFPERIHMLPAWLVICGVEAALSHADFYPERGSDYGPALSALLDYGQRQTPRDWSTAQLDRLTVVRDYERVFDEIDLLVSPATRDLPPTLEEGRTQMRGDGMRRLLAFTAPGDLTGYPTISLPAGLSENGVPFGFQITARPLREATLLRAAGAWQEDGDWVATMPSVAGAA